MKKWQGSNIEYIIVTLCTFKTAVKSDVLLQETPPQLFQWQISAQRNSIRLLGCDWHTSTTLISMCNFDIVDYARLLFDLVLFARNLVRYKVQWLLTTQFYQTLGTHSTFPNKTILNYKIILMPSTNTTKSNKMLPSYCYSYQPLLLHCFAIFKLGKRRRHLHSRNWKSKCNRLNNGEK